MLTYGFNVWLEATMIPFLGVMAVFLFVRYGTNAEINKRFRRLALSTFLRPFLKLFQLFLSTEEHILFSADGVMLML